MEPLYFTIPPSVVEFIFVIDIFRRGWQRVATGIRGVEARKDPDNRADPRCVTVHANVTIHTRT